MKIIPLPQAKAKCVQFKYGSSKDEQIKKAEGSSWLPWNWPSITESGKLKRWCSLANHRLTPTGCVLLPKNAYKI